MSEDGTMVVPEITVDVEAPVISTIECPEGKVPGWLDENGNPQGCVDNNPNPGGPKEEIPVVTDTPATVVPSDVPTTYNSPTIPSYIDTGVLVSTTPATVVPSDVPTTYNPPAIPSYIDTGVLVSTTPENSSFDDGTGGLDAGAGVMLGVVLLAAAAVTGVRAYVLSKKR